MVNGERLPAIPEGVDSIDQGNGEVTEWTFGWQRVEFSPGGRYAFRKAASVKAGFNGQGYGHRTQRDKQYEEEP